MITYILKGYDKKNKKKNAQDTYNITKSKIKLLNIHIQFFLYYMGYKGFKTTDNENGFKKFSLQRQSINYNSKTIISH